MEANGIRERLIQSLRDGAEVRLQLIETCAEAIIQAGEAVLECLRKDGKVLLFGNGGSAADAQHIAAEFVGRFHNERRPLPAIALTTDTSALTAIANDYGFEQVFARQVQALCNAGDVVFAISTSGRSPNILTAVSAARQRGAVVVGLTAGDAGPLGGMVDIPIVVPSTNTARIQECHIAIGHVICEILDSTMDS